MAERLSKAVAAAERQPAPRRTRNKPEERHREFVRKAIELFAEVGFEAGTRELAQRLGVTQPLLYRYFPSKDDLITAVYREIYVNRWKPQWREGLLDETQPIRDRIIAFYEDYTRTIFTPEWLRIYLFAGLRGVDINHRYAATVEAEVLRPITLATRKSFGLGDGPPAAEEIELFWTLQGGIFYYGVREIVYRFPMAVDRSTMIRNAVDTFLEGVGSVLRRLAESPETAD
ncbi:TetR/AcrR family transcriptional regulator [Ancylobacter mangrovi]|uniref:TetR/AcrR family transcriptional regulator n=1 Tax=Ancylobacter mangrovi TaxID=2972472 RepID=UPI002163787C|nr:TetR/AcrR family transcriptional regulator [Ancylobacter mangrovi]MCS0504282.1 TetR/AcrR family transcriptional regulator [Ancylobacter mangrovi]